MVYCVAGVGQDARNVFDSCVVCPVSGGRFSIECRAVRKVPALYRRASDISNKPVPVEVVDKQQMQGVAAEEVTRLPRLYPLGMISCPSGVLLGGTRDVRTRVLTSYRHLIGDGHKYSSTKQKLKLRDVEGNKGRRTYSLVHRPASNTESGFRPLSSLCMSRTEDHHSAIA